MRNLVSHTSTSLVIWLGGMLLLSWWHIDRFLNAETNYHTQKFSVATATVSQLLNQNEALLDGLVALMRTSKDNTFPTLRPYANELLQHYSHLHTVGYQPLILSVDRAKFEHDTALQLGRPFSIRTIDFDGDRRWKVSPERPFYYPVTFMAPELFDAQDVIGYDMYDDTRFRATIDSSARQAGAAVATKPFNLVEGGRGYIYLRAVDTSPTSAHATPAHLISLLIKADKLFVGVEMSVDARVALYYGNDYAATALIGSVGKLDSLPSATGRFLQLPLIVMQQDVTSAGQPFSMQYRARPQWSNLDWDSWILWLMAWSIISLDFALLVCAYPHRRYLIIR